MKVAVTDIRGVGPAMAARLADHGFSTVRRIAGAKAEKLVQVPGIGEARVGAIIAAAAELLEGGSAPAEAAAKPEAEAPDSKKKAKKGKKKDKKKDKKKGKK